MVRKAENKEQAKPKKDPNAPKRPASSYIRFSNEVREDVKIKFHLTSIGDIAKKIGGMWAELEQSKKQVYQDAYNADKAQYDKDMAAYKPAGINKDEDTGSPKASSRSPSPKANLRVASPAKKVPVRGKKPKKSAV